MSETKRIAEQLEQAFVGEAWHGPALAEVLDGVDARAAAARPIPGAHSIWEIVGHLAVWYRVPRLRIDGAPVESVPPEEDWPAVEDGSEEAWRAAVARLESEHRELQRTVAGLDDARLAHPVGDSGPTVYELLHGVVQHDLYHAGQIALLRKASGGGAP